MTSEALRAAARPADGLSELRATSHGVFWLASAPERGCKRLWRWLDGEAYAVTPPGIDVGSRVNGYGGGAYACLGDNIILVESQSQALLRQSLDSDTPRSWWARPEARYGGLLADLSRQRILAVEEQGDGRHATQRLVTVTEGHCGILAEGADFYGAPALSPDGCWLAWVEWDLPHMPWQRSRLRVAQLDHAGHIGRVETWDGGAAVTQPTFGGDGQLVFMSDHEGWWRPYCLEGMSVRCICKAPADHVPTPWQLGECHHLWRGGTEPADGATLYFEEGAAHVLHVDARGEAIARLLPEATRVIGLAQIEGWLYALTQGPKHAARLERVHLASGEIQQLVALATPEDAPEPSTVSVRVGDAEQVTAFIYAPDGTGTRLPVIVRVHGGPTSASYPVYDPLVYWWVRQGFAVADINPRGSGNWGRKFRERLAGEWGRLDVEDVIALAEALITRGLADPEQLFIRGQSAGGFTVLNALATTSLFRAGASLYGVTDAPHLAEQTHRFESGYLDWLLGDTESQRSRSPRYRVEDIQAPVIFFQGTQDRVVVPAQTLVMADALRERGIVTEVVMFEEEGHGIRHPDNRQRMISDEMAFYMAALSSESQ
ncbi:prolyl oligopeptidase family serine peptidase [Modicisalibacter luteus]|uniref:Prolyl oligopeptidase family serine peptidase n=2 Tax=Modicisalibacter luteus TaxID=453962 RepID=A0ABV7LYC0_9GAMM|nr:prolyl oligopeptidase family serine peptidase [Halomonas lutea]GHB01620.1 peptidase S9 [Halomonas lutea]